ncbi:MAG: hypothetical protein QM621_12720 [Aeromicrobium sp.]|uniref:hypothetical protein n=1 Tax=Aeromicrobium sp. TaxID=1871063 RepID=UPI0039E52F32
MERWRTRTRLPIMLEALGQAEEHPATRRLVETLGGTPAAVSERLVGVPAYRSARLSFASGADLILRDGRAVAVCLRLARPGAPGIDLAAWIPGVGNEAMLEDLTTALEAPRSFAGLGTPYFTLDGGYLRCDFADRRGWNEAGNLVGVTVTTGDPGLVFRPEDDECAVCADLLVRTVSGGLDVSATVDALAAALEDGLLAENAHWVRLADLQPLHASGLMKRAESQLTCTACRRVLCLTLRRSASAKFVYASPNDARRHRMEAIPPVEWWGDAERIAQAAAAMRYVDHEPGAWFLVERAGTFFLEVRYVISSMLDDSALIELDEAEAKAYRTEGHEYADRLARRVRDGSPHLDDSPWHARNLLRGPDAKQLRDEVTAAVVNHTWLAEQRRSR